MQFMLIIWLQGIRLPLHRYDYASTPLWAGIYLLPLTVGFLVAGPVSGTLSDRFGGRAFATGGLLLVTATFVGFLFLPWTSATAGSPSFSQSTASGPVSCRPRTPRRS
jgi:MFS family permease